jgi:hypothetical protein
LLGPFERANLSHWTTHVKVQVLLRPTVSLRFRLGVKPPSVAHDQIFITVEHLRSLCFGAPFLTRGRGCNLPIHFAVTLRPKSRRTHNHIFLPHLRLPQPGRPGSRIYIPRNSVAELYPRVLGSPLSPLTTLRSTMEVL